jgi:UDP-N-acetylglucosamine 3-dehydrogenase
VEKTGKRNHRFDERRYLVNAMRKLSVGVIGLGSWGKNHVRVFSELENVELVAVCDIDSHRAKYIARKYQIQSYTSIEAFLKREDIEAISICTPTTTHYQIADRAIGCGKHLFVEKPMVSTFKEAQRLLATAKMLEVRLMVGFIERFNPGIQRVKALIREGALGNVVLAFAKRVGRWPERIGDVGVVKDTAIHDLDIMRFIFEQEPRSIYARMGSLGHKFEEYAHIVLGFNDIQTGFVEANWLTPHKIRTLTITGEEAVVTLNYLTQEITIEDYEKIVKPTYTWKEPLALELKEFVQSVLEDRTPKVTGWDGVRGLEIAEAAIKSARIDRTVKVNEKASSNALHES